MALNGMSGSNRSSSDQNSVKQAHENALQQKLGSSISSAPMANGITYAHRAPPLLQSGSMGFGSAGVNKKLGG